MSIGVPIGGGGLPDLTANPRGEGLFWFWFSLRIPDWAGASALTGPGAQGARGSSKRCWVGCVEPLRFLSLRASKSASPRNLGEGKSRGTGDQQGEPSTLSIMFQNGNAGLVKGAEGPTPAVVRSGDSDLATGESKPSTWAAAGFSPRSERMNSGSELLLLQPPVEWLENSGRIQNRGKAPTCPCT